jgi:argininosuccinate synthase
MLQAAVDEAASNTTGTARLKLYKGRVSVTGRKSPKSLYDEEVATFETDTVYDQKDAHGFIRLNSLRLRMRSRIQD